MSLWDKIANRFLDWLERVLPSIIAALSLGHSLGSKGKKEIQQELLLAQYELEKKKNAEKIREKYDGKSSKQIIDDHLSATHDNIRKGK